MSGIQGVKEKIMVGFTMANKWTDPTIVIIVSLAGGVPAWIAANVYIAMNFGILYAPLLTLAIYVYYEFVHLNTPPGEPTKYIEFKENKLQTRWGKRKIPMHMLVSWFLNDQIAFKGDCLEILQNHREEFIDWRPNWDLYMFLIKQLFPATSSSIKSIAATTKEIEEHYDRGNDFFAAFLGPKMIYTSAFYHGLHQSLEDAQDNKLNMLCEKLHMKKGDRFLDIGCGWGTLVRWAASKFGAKATGVTLSKEGTKWCRDNAAKDGLTEAQCEILNCDYRDIPADRKFDCISAVEMAEHVGIANFQLFLKNVSSMLEDDGLFYMQVAGLRKGSNWQDTQWGLFMSRYIFPGADASTPLYWYVQQLEMAGFEVHSVETVGRHYSWTLKAWYDYWMANRKKPELKRYAELDMPEFGITSKGSLSRLWEIFLAWSVIAAGIGSATCYQIISHKNRYEFPRDNFCSKEIQEQRKKVGTSL